MKKYGKVIIIVVGVFIIIVLIFLIYLKIAFVSRNEVKDIVANNMNVSSGSLYFDSIDFELDKGIYEVEVYYQNREYEYKIDAKNGKIIYTDFKYFTNQNNSTDSNNNSNNNQNDINHQAGNISAEEAENIALTHTNLDANSVQFLRTEMEHEHGTLIYEVDFVYNNFDYDYKINVMTGEIISYDRDTHHD